MKKIRINMMVMLVGMVLILSYTMLLPPEAEAFRKTKTSVTVRELPQGHKTIVVNKKSYHYHGGRFYLKSGRGYRVVAAPAGAVVVALPAGYTRVVVGGSSYFYFGGVYYQPAAGGYVVVDVPAHSPEKIVVTAAVLNVRSGPGTGFGIYRTIHNGAMLRVVETSASGKWYFVELPDGSRGWVMRTFTAAYHPEADG